jgi:uncharacterized protein
VTEVSWTLGETTVEGTLLEAPGPGVVLVAGSGPTDRDWNSPLLGGSNGSGRLLAEALAEAGFASLRYDKRASGPHVAENMRVLTGKLSMRTHLDELAGAIRELGADHAPVFGLGNSEGTLHVLNYQQSDPEIPFAGLVLVAPPGRSVGAVARAQLAAQAAALPDGDALLALYDEAIARFLAGEPMAPDPALPPGVHALLQALESPANLPFARELWNADASSLLARVTAPTLVVIGQKDLQVSWTDDGEPLRRAARDNVTFAFPENANHVLKHEPRPYAELTQAEALPAYNAPDAVLDAEAVEVILAWLSRPPRPG